MRIEIILALAALVGCASSDFTGGDSNSGSNDSADKMPGHDDGDDADESNVDMAGGSVGTSHETGESADDIDLANAGGQQTIDTSSGCIALPPGSTGTSGSQSGDTFRNTLFHRNVAVDPGRTGVDPAPTYPGYRPYPISPDAELSSTEFALSLPLLRALIDQGVTEVEYFVFAHQFGSGLDKIAVTLVTAAGELRDVSNVNIYSAYGYLSVRNLRRSGDTVIGDVQIKSFNYDPNGVGPLYDKIRAVSASPQDGTDLVGPAAVESVAKVDRKDYDLNGFKATIEIDADSYDSVQYRALRATLWAPTEVKLPKPC